MISPKPWGVGVVERGLGFQKLGQDPRTFLSSKLHLDPKPGSGFRVWGLGLGFRVGIQVGAP